MTAALLTLDGTFARTRRLELRIGVRHIADALGLAEPAYKRMENGKGTEVLTLAQLGALADLLGLPPTDLLLDRGASCAVPMVTYSPLVERLGSLLMSVGHAVSVGLLAEALETTTDEVVAAADQLRDRVAPAGLKIGVYKGTLTLTTGRGSMRDPAVRKLLRAAGHRGSVNASPARLLHQLASGRQMGLTQSKEDQHRLSVLLRAGWARADGPVAARSVTVHPDVRFSLALDEGNPCGSAVATVEEVALRRGRLPWLTDTTDSTTGTDSTTDTGTEDT